MSQIEVLGSEVIDQIAAGEVVERPAHLVKELIENAIDAKASKIEVHLSEGGRWVRILDNGDGMDRVDLERCLDRFATSKIRKSDDLWKLHSFGFRGEALASISAVSRIEITTRKKEAPTAHRLVSHFGKRESIEQLSGEIGTKVLMQDLFGNVPARLKFLKTPGAEIGAIKNVIKALALSHPAIEFRVFVESQLEYLWTTVSSHLQRARDVLRLSELFEATGEFQRMKVQAYFSSPHEVAKSSRNMWFFAQNRWIQDRSLQAAVMEAYRSSLMHGEYPTVVVFVQTNTDEIDVNIHPTKSQVKFLDQGGVFRLVQSAIKSALQKIPSRPSVQLNSETNGSEAFFAECLTIQNPPSLTSNKEEPEFIERVSDQTYLSDQRLESSNVASPQLRYENLKLTMDLSEQKSFYWSSLQILGQLNLTYLVCEAKDQMVLIDQHAAHERILYERIQVLVKNRKLERQDFLFPFAIDLPAERIEALFQMEKDLDFLGFTLERLGPQTLGIKSASPLIKDSVIPMIMEKVSQEVLEHGTSFSLDAHLGDLIATMACHSAIRAGDRLSMEEMRALLEQMDQYSFSSFCPHGRPVSVAKNFREIEKEFCRIV